MHPDAFQYLKPTDEQRDRMAVLRAAAREFSLALETTLPDGADKTFALRNHRTTVMWGNVAITRYADGAPRPDAD